MTALSASYIAARCFTTVWALITWAMAAGTVGAVGDADVHLGKGPAIALLVSSFLVFLYLSATFIGVWLYYISPSILVDTIIQLALFLATLVATALTLNAFGEDCTQSFCQLSSATGGIGIVLPLLTFGMILFSVIYIRKRHAHGYTAFKQPILYRSTKDKRLGCFVTMVSVTSPNKNDIAEQVGAQV